jgi:hypothetical protein
MLLMICSFLCRKNNMKRNSQLFLFLCTAAVRAKRLRQQQQDGMEERIKIFDTRKSLKAFSSYHFECCLHLLPLEYFFLSYSIIFYLDFNFLPSYLHFYVQFMDIIYMYIHSLLTHTTITSTEMDGTKKRHIFLLDFLSFFNRIKFHFLLLLLPWFTSWYSYIYKNT